MAGEQVNPMRQSSIELLRIAVLLSSQHAGLHRDVENRSSYNVVLRLHKSPCRHIVRLLASLLQQDRVLQQSHQLYSFFRIGNIAISSESLHHFGLYENRSTAIQQSWLCHVFRLYRHLHTLCFHHRDSD